jgi:hypothetical protein
MDSIFVKQYLRVFLGYMEAISTAHTETLIVAQLLEKFLGFYESKKFITVLNLPVVPILNQMITVCILVPCLFRISFNIILQFTSTSPKWYFLSHFQTTIFTHLSCYISHSSPSFDYKWVASTDFFHSFPVHNSLIIVLFDAT